VYQYIRTHINHWNKPSVSRGQKKNRKGKAQGESTTAANKTKGKRKKMNNCTGLDLSPETTKIAKTRGRHAAVPLRLFKAPSSVSPRLVWANTIRPFGGLLTVHTILPLLTLLGLKLLYPFGHMCYMQGSQVQVDVVGARPHAEPHCPLRSLRFR
jgi:hypothetical protein